MKKRSSIWMLCAGSTVNRLLALLVLMAAGSAGLFWLARPQESSNWPGLEMAFRQSHISWLFLLIFLLWTAVLLMPEHTKAMYTLNRLQVTPRQILVIQSCYNALSYVVLWGAQVLLLIALFRWAGSTMPRELYGPQSILLAFYRDDTLHSLMPLADWPRYLRNLAVLIGCGTSAAVVSRGLRRTNLYLVPLLVLAGGLAIWFPAEIGAWNNDVMLSFAVLMTAGIMVAVAAPDLGKEEPDGEG